MVKAYIYARVSTHDQNIDTQLNEIKKYCDFRNVEVMGVYQDKLSGKNTDRPGYQKLLGDMIVNPLGVEAVIVYKLDRVGRSIRGLIEFTDFLQKHYIGFISISNNIDTTTKEGRLFFYMMSAIAEYERELILERVTLGREAAIKKGVKMGQPAKNIPVEEVKRLLAEGVSKSAIARKYGVHRCTIYDRIKK